MEPSLDKDLDISEAAKNLHAGSLVWDATFPFLRAPTNHTLTLERMVKAGYNCVSLTVAVDPSNMPETSRYLALVRQYILARPEQYVLVETVRDIETSRSSGKLGLVLSFQGTTPFERDLSLVEFYYKLGIRHALMAFNQKNYVGDGCHERTDAGLSRFGLELVAEMERVGIIVDCTHTGLRTTMDVMEFATKPVMFSHSSPRALWDHERNISDEQIRACAATGGVIGVTGVGIFMGHNDISAETIFRHVDYIAQLVGPQHVGFGFDYVADSALTLAIVRANASKYPGGQYPSSQLDFAPPETMAEVTGQMILHGYSEADIRGILGQNWLRIARECWK